MWAQWRSAHYVDVLGDLRPEAAGAGLGEERQRQWGKEMFPKEEAWSPICSLHPRTDGASFREAVGKPAMGGSFAYCRKWRPLVFPQAGGTGRGGGALALDLETQGPCSGVSFTVAAGQLWGEDLPQESSLE